PSHHAEGGRLTRMFRTTLDACMRHRWTTIIATVLIFAVSVFGMRFVQQQFFPSSDRNELVIDFNLPQNSSIAETNAQMAKFEQDGLK
ncbi:efflux RND transporter permease subunit, partial [Klebsiella aerogenes]|uniref:efflux RND transporter permease subunit n=1 Tax=Klebsiella aerogenes TaxID=548 RepID=UPI0013D45883